VLRWQNLTMTLPPARKGIYLSHPSSLEHDPRELIPGHPDVPERLVAIEALLGAEDWLGWERRASPAASERELELIHAPELVGRIKRLAEGGGGAVDLDTAVTPRSWGAALHAVGGACELVRELLTGQASFGCSVARPPGHHAGPDFIGGYCYLNNAAAATWALRVGGLAPVGVLDLDLHYPNGTSELVERMGADATLHSLHAAPVTNVAAGTELPRAPRERAHAFGTAPDPVAYLAEVEASLTELSTDSAALVVSLGYDTAEGDPHGTWHFGPEVFAGIGRLLAATELPVCIVQEGGYALEALAPCSHAFASGLLGEDPV